MKTIFFKNMPLSMTQSLPFLPHLTHFHSNLNFHSGLSVQYTNSLKSNPPVIPLKKNFPLNRKIAIGVCACAETESPLSIISIEEKSLNSFSLLGKVLKDPEIKFVNSDESQCDLIIEVLCDESSTERFSLTIYQELAERLSEVAVKGSEVLVTGYIRCSNELYLDVTDVKLVQRKKFKETGNYSKEEEDVSTEDLWKLLMNDFNQWYDNRNKKRSEKSPDFVHKSRKKGWVLWINSRMPNWVNLNQLGIGNAYGGDDFHHVNAQKTRKDQNQIHDYDEEYLWQDLFDNPSGWWDNRENKKNPKQPDFVYKNKELGFALWLTSRRLPAWVPEKINEL